MAPRHRVPSQARRSLPIVVCSHALSRRLIVESRDLDTDVRAPEELDVGAPTDQAGQHAAVVAWLRLKARARSFENGDVSH